MYIADDNRFMMTLATTDDTVETTPEVIDVTYLILAEDIQGPLPHMYLCICFCSSD